MIRSARSLVRAASGAAVVAILGFGAVEAFAAPPTGPETANRFCSRLVCYKDCVDAGYHNGGCVNGVCQCLD